MIILSRFRQQLKKIIYIISEFLIFIAIIILYVKAAFRSKISNPSEAVFGIFIFVLFLNLMMGLCTMCNFDREEEGDEPVPDGTEKLKAGDTQMNKVQ